MDYETLELNVIKLKDILKESIGGMVTIGALNNPFPTRKEKINEASSVNFEVHSDPDKTERSFVAGFKELAKGHGSIIDYGPRETDSYDWNDRSNYESAKKEYNVYMNKIAMRLNSTVHDMNQIYKVWDKISTKYRKKDKD